MSSYIIKLPTNNGNCRIVAMANNRQTAKRLCEQIARTEANNIAAMRGNRTIYALV